MSHFERNGLLVDVQHGFRKGRSCETQLAALVQDLAKVLDNRGQTDMILLDFSKAFDSVPHQRLLLKLHNMGVRKNTLNWIGEFLTNRHQQVVLEGASSSRCKVTSGVPQGTVLGPLLFLAYINDLPSVVKSKVRLFADDCILYREISTNPDTNLLQEDLDSMVRWGKTWQMTFNATKCYSMSVSHKKKPIQREYVMGSCILKAAKHHPYLGVEISNDLSWSKHIDQYHLKQTKLLGY